MRVKRACRNTASSFLKLETGYLSFTKTEGAKHDPGSSNIIIVSFYR